MTPDGLQRLLNFYRWDADAVRDDLRSSVLDHVADTSGVVVADELAAGAPRKAWQRLSAGAGSRGQRLYDWLLLVPDADTHALMVRRLIGKPTELAYHVCHLHYVHSESTPSPLRPPTHTPAMTAS